MIFNNGFSYHFLKDLAFSGKKRIFAHVKALNGLEGKKAVYYTLGCKLNFAETSTIGQQMKAAGVETVRSGEVADICIVNTCSVTEVADSKGRQAISRLRHKHPGALMVVTGCYAQLRPIQVAALEGVDLVVGAEQKGDIPRLVAERMAMMPEERTLAAHEHLTTRTADIRSFMPSCACGERTRFFLKVQDGCDYYCTYCTIPFARGRSRNGSIASLVRQAEEAAALVLRNAEEAARKAEEKAAANAELMLQRAQEDSDAFWKDVTEAIRKQLASGGGTDDGK